MTNEPPAWPGPAEGTPVPGVGTSSGREWLPALDVPEPGSQRRLTVLLRLLLAVPQILVLVVLGVLAWFVTVIGWFAALVIGRLPEFAERYLSGFLAYETRVTAYLMLLVDTYPPFAFDAPKHPVAIELRPGRLNRLAVLFRIVLMIPAAVIESVTTAGWWALSFLCWLVVLVLGRMPRPLFEATAAIMRYSMRYQAYLMMLTSSYPKRLFGDANEGPAPLRAPGVRASATRPLVLSGGGTALLVIFVVVGLVTSVFSRVDSGNNDSTTAVRPTVVHSAGR